jgi:hypothetical protein
MVEFHSGAARRDPACPIQAQNRPERYKSLRYAAYRAPNSRIISESSYGPLAAPLKTSNQLCGFLQRLKLVLDGLAAITGRYTNIKRGTLG